MFDELKKTDENEKDLNIDRILNSMAYGREFKYTYEDLFGEFDGRSTSYQYLMLNEVHDEMVYEDLITSQWRQDTRTDGKYRLISLTIRGYQIKKKGGWTKYKRGLKTTFVDGQIVKWSIVFVTLGSFGILVWSEFIKGRVPTEPIPIETKKLELNTSQPSTKKDSTYQDSIQIK
ncbi:hypothetical protein [Chryseolinea sp. H1M3-3]|uniref:hypothetical protein n=1 Tax=Chryseolinea sp. H1M3-3 TaxID=3034144 RepID=UPI0023EB5C7A|nr:hypothetical protein [Chryseolinea sp. H1M3-3]